MGFQIPLDIANRALQHCGRARIHILDEQSAQGREVTFAYDKLRDAELRRNVWRFAIRRCVLRPIDGSTVIWTPPNWAAATTYSPGYVVQYTPPTSGTSEVGANPIGYYWITDQAITGAATNSAPDVDTRWHRYFGPVTCDPYAPAATTLAAPGAPTLTNAAGGAMGKQQVYLKVTYVGSAGETVASGETADTVPASQLFTVASPPAATGADHYNVYASATSGTETLQNGSPILLGSNWTEPTTGLVFGKSPPPAAISAYFTGELTILGGTVYSSLISNNKDTPPTPNWLAQGGTTAQLQLVYPIGTGPATDQTTLNAYRLPYGWLRKAPEDPRSDYLPYLGAPVGLRDDDWVYEGNYLISRDPGPLMVRFVGDMIDVWDFDPMFCEGLAARVAMEIAPGLVPKDELALVLANVRAHYREEMTEARMANAVAIGSEAPPLDDYIAVRW